MKLHKLNKVDYYKDYHSVNVISLSLSQSDHNKQLSLQLMIIFIVIC